jgi:hypothetical protein
LVAVIGLIASDALAQHSGTIRIGRGFARLVASPAGQLRSVSGAVTGSGNEGYIAIGPLHGRSSKPGIYGVTGTHFAMDLDFDAKNDVVEVDNDQDGLTDLEEAQYGTNHRRADTESDGMSDSFEIRFGLDPFVDDSASDPDADWLTNLAEARSGLDPHRPSLPLPAGWSLVSVPWEEAGLPREQAADGVRLFQWHDGSLRPLAIDETMTSGAGYWAHAPRRMGINYTEAERSSHALSLKAGWNLVGVVSERDPPSLDGALTWWQWSDHGFRKPDTLRPFVGYWVFAEYAIVLPGN